MNRFKVFCFALLCASLFSGSAVVYAQESTSTVSTSTSVVASESTSTDPVTAPIPTAKTGLSAIAQQRITNLAANMSNRMESVARRMEQVSIRIDSRIKKLAYEGTDTSDAAASLLTAQTALKDFRTSFADIDTQVGNFVRSAQPRESWSSLRTTYIQAKENLVEAHIALKAATTHLSAPSTISTPVASSSATSTVTE